MVLPTARKGSLHNTCKNRRHDVCRVINARLVTFIAQADVSERCASVLGCATMNATSFLSTVLLRSTATAAQYLGNILFVEPPRLGEELEPVPVRWQVTRRNHDGSVVQETLGNAGLHA